MNLAQIEGLVGRYRGPDDRLVYARKLLAENPEAVSEVRKILNEDFENWTPGAMGIDRNGRRVIIYPNGGEHYEVNGADGKRYAVTMIWGCAMFLLAVSE